MLLSMLCYAVLIGSLKKAFQYKANSLTLLRQIWDEKTAYITKAALNSHVSQLYCMQLSSLTVFVTAAHTFWRKLKVQQ